MILGPDRDSGSRGRAPLPLFDRIEGEVPAVRRDFCLLPEAVRIEPRMLPADGHPRIRLAFEFLDVVVGHGDRLAGSVLGLRPGEGCPKVRLERMMGYPGKRFIRRVLSSGWHEGGDATDSWRFEHRRLNRGDCGGLCLRTVPSGVAEANVCRRRSLGLYPRCLAQHR